MPPTSRWSISTDRSGSGKAEYIEGLAIVDEFQFQLCPVDAAATKLDIADSIAITVAANIGDDLFHHQLDFVHPGDGKAGLLALAPLTNSVQWATASMVGASVRAIAHRRCHGGYLSLYTAAAAGEIAASASRTVGKIVEHHVEAADLENFLDSRLQAGEHHLAILLAASFGGDHQDPQAGAAHIVDFAEIDQQFFLFPGAAFDMG